MEDSARKATRKEREKRDFSWPNFSRKISLPFSAAENILSQILYLSIISCIHPHLQFEGELTQTNIDDTCKLFILPQSHSKVVFRLKLKQLGDNKRQHLKSEKQGDEDADDVIVHRPTEQEASAFGQRQVERAHGSRCRSAF